MSDETLESRRRTAVVWSFLLTGGQTVLRTVVLFVMAALVGPEAYGLVALALAYVMFVQILLDQGLGAAIIQREDLQDEHLDSGFWMLIGVATGLSLATLGLAGWYADFQGIPELETVVLVLALLLPFRALTVVQEAILRRDLEYKSLAFRANFALVCSGAVGIAAALAGAEHWALVYEQLTNAGVQLIVLWSVSRWRPRFRFSAPHARQLLSFSFGTFLAAIGSFLLSRADSLLMGRYFGATAVGLYRFAWRVVFSLVDIVVNSLRGVAFSYLSRLQDDRDAFFDSTISTIRTGALLLVPALGVVAGAGPDLLAFVGDEWTPAGDALRLLCIYGTVSTFTFLAGPVLNALGKPYRFAAFVWFIAAITVTAFVLVGRAMQDNPVADQLLSITIVNVVMLGIVSAIISALLVGHALERPWTPFLTQFMRPSLAGLLAFGAVELANVIGVRNIGAPIVRLFINSSIGAIVAVAAAVALVPHARHMIRQGRDRLMVGRSRAAV